MNNDFFKNKVRSIIEHKALGFLIGSLLVLIIWHILSIVFPGLFSGIKEVVLNIVEDFNHPHRKNIEDLAKFSFWGLLISLITCFITIMLVAIFRPFEIIITPSIVILKATPIVAFIPVINAIYSPDETGGKILAAFLISFFPLMITGFDGFKRVPDKLKVLSAVYGANSFRRFIRIEIGFVCESILSGLKISAPLSVVGAVVGQSLIGNGMGAWVATSINDGETISNIVSIVLCSAVGITFYVIAYLIHMTYEELLCLRK